MIIDSHCHAWDYWPYQDKNNHEPNHNKHKPNHDKHEANHNINEPKTRM